VTILQINLVHRVFPSSLPGLRSMPPVSRSYSGGGLFGAIFQTAVRIVMINRGLVNWTSHKPKRLPAFQERPFHGRT
jgi:hypothetical protein